MKVKKILQEKINNQESISAIEDFIKSGGYTKMSFVEYESLLNSLFITNKSQLVKLINSYYSKLVDSNPIQFFHLKILSDRVTAPCRDLIQNYKYIYMYNRYLDCSELLINWSPTEAYFPLLKYIQDSNPDKPIDYTYWLKRFSELPTALKFLRENSIPIDFTDKKDLVELYKTIPQQYIQDFLNLLGTKPWYIEAIKDTDHFLEEIEGWEE
jgi:hypothetical protein